MARPEILHDSVRNGVLVEVMNETMGKVYIIDNNGALKETRRQLIDVLARLNEQ